MTTAIARRKSPSVSKVDQVAAMFARWEDLKYDEQLCGHPVHGNLPAVAEKALSEYLREHFLGKAFDLGGNGGCLFGVFETTEPGRVDFPDATDSQSIATIGDKVSSCLIDRTL